MHGHLLRIAIRNLKPRYGFAFSICVPRYKMASASKAGAPKDEVVPVDITHNLKTLQFESALTDEEQNLLHLRARSHAITVTSCAHATFVVKVLHETRQIRKQMKNPQKKAAKILQDSDSRDPLKVGILGCGRVGSQLAHCLLTYAGVAPKNLKISTRRPETLEYLQNKGVECFHDNIKLVSNSHLIFLTILPSQIPVVTEEIKDHVPAAAVLYSLVTSYSPKRLKQLLLTNNVIHPLYTWSAETQNSDWDITCNVNTALENTDIVRKTFPLRQWMSEGLIQTNDKFLELVIFAVLNMCTHLRLTKEEGLGVLHTVMFRDTEDDRLRETDFVKKMAVEQENFPLFDLVRISQTNTSVHKRLAGSPALENAAFTNYTSIFESYVQKKLIQLQNQKKF